MDDSTRQSALRTASAIGNDLIASALTTGDLCTWVGGLPSTYDQPPGLVRHRILGRSIYDGTAGIAIFLAALARVTGNGLAAETALRALRFATRGDPTADLPLGLYEGYAGLHIAGTLVRDLLDSGESHQSSGIRSAVPQAGRQAALNLDNVDLLAGQAGVLLALIADRPNSPSDQELALALGDTLLAKAVARRDGLVWVPARSVARRPLTGMSHGAAGIALALTALSVASGAKRFQEASERAVTWENKTFDRSSNNWPDFRRQATSDPGFSRRPACLSFWCHGAPGVLLSRVIALKLQSAADMTHTAEALNTTRAAIRRALLGSAPDMSLCHGLFGLIDILMQATSPAIDRSAEDAGLIADAVACADGIVAAGRPLHCGTHGAETPGAMLGSAGVGLTLLRVHDETLPSLLNVTRLGRDDG